MRFEKPLHWSEGLFLQQHHFQYFQHFLQTRDRQTRELLMTYPWGFLQVETDDEALENLRVAVTRAAAVFPGGAEIAMPGNAAILPLDLKDLLADDPPLYAFFERMLTDDRALVDGTIVHEPHGVMAGTPTSPFLADVYLMEVDRHFDEAGVVYARYSDDIILFAPDRESLEAQKAVLLAYLKEYRLEVNPEKEKIYAPEEPFEFLGFRCQGETIDIAAAVRCKMKGKIRRAARALARWRDAKGIGAEQAMKALNRQFNAKLFEGDDPDSLSWSRWFFPVINRTEGLQEIDHYLQQSIRYLASGRHTKANYRVRYADLKALGYRSLVHEFYRSSSQKHATAH